MQKSLIDDVIRGAQFSDCRTYRYALWRIWGKQHQMLMVIGLNPSTADETVDDPTIRRCIGFAKRLGFDGLYMLNLFAFRATDPRVMEKADDPVGPGNLEAFGYYRTKCQKIVAAWGAHQLARAQGVRVTENLWRVVECWGKTKDGHPRHPLYLKGDTQLDAYYSPPGI
jgi:hypothetical protein